MHAARGTKRAGRRSTRRWERQSLDDLEKRWARPELRLYSSVDSTNEVAKELAQGGAPAGTLVLADAQTAGRGRGDRSWASPKGAGLYFSLILRPDSLPNPALLPIRAGLGVVRVLARLVPDARPALKWPNDVLLADKKAGGVLAEATWDGSRVRHVVLGIGLNVSTKERDLPKPIRAAATSVQEASGALVSRLELMDALLAELDRVLARPGEPMEPELLRDLDASDWLRDRRCVLVEPDKEKETEGVAAGIAPDGALLFRPDTGPLRRIVSAHVRAPSLEPPAY
jgi:BirA family biotin operon repressor/biotin-[acetyl-CoA-carboxylase] ligase